jgi:hypothetical protein
MGNAIKKGKWLNTNRIPIEFYEGNSNRVREKQSRRQRTVGRKEGRTCPTQWRWKKRRRRKRTVLFEKMRTKWKLAAGKRRRWRRRKQAKRSGVEAR